MNREPPRRPATEASECRSCKRKILWVVWPRSGKKMPVDLAPAPAGTVVLTLSGGEYGELRAEKYNARAHHEGRRRYTSHFDTCPGQHQGQA
jgi:hypothetical protein